MGKSLRNLVFSIPLLVSSLFISHKVNAQEYNLGYDNKFILDSMKISSEMVTNYYENRTVISNTPYYDTFSDNLYAGVYCDLNDDGDYDLIELYETEFNDKGNLAMSRDSLGHIKNPLLYVFYNEKENSLDFYIDMKQDSLNGNETHFHRLRKNKNKFNKQREEVI